MIKKISLTLFLLLVSFQLWADGTSNACVAPTAPAGLRSFEDIMYKDSLGMDLYLPEHGENFPVAFIIHGGSWIHGTRTDFDPFAKQLTAMGYAAVTVDYTLANNGHKFPEPVEDLRCAIKTLRRLKYDYSLNTDHIMAIGDSAGAHLAAEIALTSDSNYFDDSACPVQNFGTEVQSVVGYYGPYDLRSTAGLNLGQIYVLQNFLGGLPLFNPKEAQQASPMAQIRGQNIPFYLVQAVNDDMVPVRSSREFSDALNKANMQEKYVEATDGAHTLQYFDTRPFATEATCEMINTLNNFVADAPQNLR